MCSRLNQPLSDIQPRGAIDVVSSVLVICRGPPFETPPSAVPPLHCLRLSRAGAVWQSLDSPSRRWPNSRRQRAPQARRNWPQKRSRRLSIPLRHRKNARRDGGDSPKGRWSFAMIASIYLRRRGNDVLPEMEYPHWMMVAGAWLVVAGFIGLGFSRYMNRAPAEDNLHPAAPPRRTIRRLAMTVSRH